VPIDTEAVREEDRALARQWAKHHRLDAIVTTDGDADRPLIADENGEWIRGDVAGILCARAIGARTVVTPVSSNSAVEGCGAFSQVIRTRIGSPHVIAAMEGARIRPAAGYEANGGFLLGDAVTLEGGTLDALPTRDSLLPMLMLLTAARRSGGHLSSLVAALPRRFTHSDRLQNVDVAACRALLGSLDSEEHRVAELGGGSLGRAVHADRTDGLRLTFESGDIVHLRLSGNAPELRCYTESETPTLAAQLCRAVLERISQKLREPSRNPAFL
jgi:phosphomannomutase